MVQIIVIALLLIVSLCSIKSTDTDEYKYPCQRVCFEQQTDDRKGEWVYWDGQYCKKGSRKRERFIMGGDASETSGFQFCKKLAIGSWLGIEVSHILRSLKRVRYTTQTINITVTEQVANIYIKVNRQKRYGDIYVEYKNGTQVFEGVEVPILVTEKPGYPIHRDSRN